VGVRDWVAKRFGTGIPPEIQAAEDAAQMGPDHPFSPGEPVRPYDGYSRTPRAFDYQTSYNVATRPRTHERVSFDVLRALIENYDVSQICIQHRIDSIRSLKWKLIAADGCSTDITDAIPLGMAALNKPDRRNSFKTWLARYLYDILAYDAGTLYRMRNRGGKCIGLKTIDGSSIAPLLDYWGESPEPPAEAYVQYANGLPWNWLTRDDLIYEPFRPRTNSPYGHAPLESILLNANCYSDDTEVLTDRGWLRFAEVDISSDRFATRNPATAAFEWQSADRYYEADSDGIMYHAATRNVDLLVTGGHRLLVNRLPKGCPGVRHGSEWLVHAEDLYEYQSALPGGGAGVRCPVTSTWSAPDLECFTLPVSPCDFVRMDGAAVREARANASFPACSSGVLHPTLRRGERGDRLLRSSAEAVCDAYGLPRSVIREDAHYFSKRIEGDDFAAFMGMYLSEGCVRPDGSNITIAQEEFSKGYVEFRDLLARMLGREAPYHRGAFTFGHTALADYLRPFGKAHEKYIPAEVLGMSRRQLEIFWHFYVLGDGAIYPRTVIVSTSSKRIADGLQEVLQKIGSSAAVRPGGKPAKPTHHQRWHVQTRRKPAYRIDVERVPYQGKVYCVSVPNKTLYVRRNGYPTWCANTDLRFQSYFLDRFTSGNVPEAFASAPEGWSPDQIEQFQALWDSVMFGDQSQKHQIKWMPGGSSIAWSNEKDFSDAFSLHLMRKTASAYHVVPADLGFTESVNRSSGESQADVQHRVGDLPLMEHVEGILSQFLYDDMGLPLRLEFDRGEEQDDQLDVAHSDDVYIKNGVVGASEIREMRFGLTEPEGQQVPRFVYTTRAGPIPLSSLLDVAGPTDPETAAPMPGVPLPHKEFELVEGVVPVPAPKAPALAERLYGPPAVPGAPPPGSVQPPSQPLPVAKAETTGITADTGITSYDLDDDEDEDEREELAKAELAAFRRFTKARRRAGTWRDFTFTAVEPETARALNHGGRTSIAKAGGSAGAPKDAEVRKATLHIGHLTGIWATIYRRRERLLNKHIKLVAAAWDECLTGLHPRDVVRDFREDAGLIAKAADPDQEWWKGAATAAAVAWLDGVYNSGGYPALVTAIEDAIREGMAEGQADALALAADKQGAAGFQIGRAFTAANEQLAGDSGVAERAQDTAGKVVGGAGNDVGRALADGAKSGAGVEDMTSDVRDAVTGDQSRSVSANTDGALSAAILAGAVALYGQAAAAQAAGGGSGQGADAAAASAQPPSVLLDWITAGDDRVCNTCSDYEDNSPYTPEAVPDYPHPACRCSVDTASEDAPFLNALLAAD
jgi:hypothetical protein